MKATLSKMEFKCIINGINLCDSINFDTVDTDKDGFSIYSLSESRAFVPYEHTVSVDVNEFQKRETGFTKSSMEILTGFGDTGCYSVIDASWMQRSWSYNIKTHSLLV